MSKRSNISPFDEAHLAIDDLWSEAKVWLDGAEVTTQEQADLIGTLLGLTRKAGSSLEKEFKVEKRPILDAGKALGVKYKPDRDRVEAIETTCKAALKPFLAAKDAKAAEDARIARDEADRAEFAAQQAMQHSSITDIEERVQAEKMLEAAKAKTFAADKLAKAKVQAKGEGRSVGLRTTYIPELVDLNAAIRYYWDSHRELFETLAMDQATKDVKAGMRKIPGFEIIERKDVV